MSGSMASSDTHTVRVLSEEQLVVRSNAYKQIVTTPIRYTPEYIQEKGAKAIGLLTVLVKKEGPEKTLDLIAKDLKTYYWGLWKRIPYEIGDTKCVVFELILDGVLSYYYVKYMSLKTTF